MPLNFREKNGFTPQHLKKKRKKNLLIAFAVLLFLILSTTIQTYIQQLKFPSPFTNNVLVFVLVNINVILLVFLFLIIARNLFKLYSERKHKVIGSAFKTKLIIALVMISIIPSCLILWVASGFIASSIDNWFNLQLEGSLKNSLELGQDYYSNHKKILLTSAKNIAQIIQEKDLNYDLLAKIVAKKRAEYEVNQIVLFDQDLEEKISSLDSNSPVFFKQEEQIRILELVKRALEDKEVSEIISIKGKELGLGIYSFRNHNQQNALLVSSYIPPQIVEKMGNIIKVLEEYRHLQLLKYPIKASYLITFLMLALLILLSAIWLGFYLAKGITIPIQELALATKSIARGDLDVNIRVQAEDEVGLLIDSFNQMAGDLRKNKQEIEKVNADLRGTNLELDQRRNYMETILENINTGVISVDKQGRVSMLNKAAKNILEISGELKGKNYREVFDLSYLKPVRTMLKRMYEEKEENMDEELELRVLSGKQLNLIINISVLKDRSERYLGLVIVFDDLTELIKNQKIAAWREVARGIAHEVKNPLTPIKLNTQRLRKKFFEKAADFSQVFDQSTNIIIKEVDTLKGLVDDFSDFARLSVPSPAPCSLPNLIDEIILLYQGLNKHVEIEKRYDPGIDLINLDKEQIKRVFINLIENSLEAMDNGGKIIIKTIRQSDRQRVRIEIYDNGKGIPSQDKDKLFWPYFSTKRHGTGLGLAIVQRIITDHKGLIAVKDNYPQGAIFVIELPV